MRRTTQPVNYAFSPASFKGLKNIWQCTIASPARKLLCIALLSTLSLNAISQVIYIAPNATGNGSSWTDATGDLQAALNTAAPGTEIWIKTGTYFPTTCDSCTYNDRNRAFIIPDSVEIYGGFAGTETHPDLRNIAENPTYLSGDIDGDGTPTNNSFTIIYTKDVSDQTRADGLIITGGNADRIDAGLGTPPCSGGGWYNLGSTSTGSSHPVIVNCTFLGNYAWGYGGGMFNDGSFSGSCNPTLINCKFIGNTTDLGGGAMYNTGSFGGTCSPELTDCLFKDNECLESDGGGIFNIGADGGIASLQVTSCTFTGNIAAHDGGALYNFGKGGVSSPSFDGCLFKANRAHAGGAAYNDGSFGGLMEGVFTHCTFTENLAVESDGGAIYNSGYLGTSSPSFINCLFEQNNSAFAGGAIFSNGVEGICNAVISRCRFTGNTADTYGGALYNQGKSGHASPTVTNTLFYDNSALSAGAVYNLGSEEGQANAKFINCTFYGNHANVGGAVYCNAGEEGTGTSSPQLFNCIFRDNNASDEGDIFRIIWGTPEIDFSLVDKSGCDALYNGNQGSLTCGEGMVFNDDPLFLDAAGGNFHLTLSSPAVDGGDNSVAETNGILIDLDNLPRIFNGTADMGVFEFGSTTGGTPVIARQPQNVEACTGEEIVFSVVAFGEPPLAFQWMKGDLPIPGADQNEWTIENTMVSDAGTYRCEIVSASGDTVVSIPALLTVSEPVAVSITISASQLDICKGESIVLYAEAVNGGTAPGYQWYLNGAAVGSNTQQFSTGNINDGDTFTCELTSSEGCVINIQDISNSLTIHVESPLDPALTIAADPPVPCEGQEVTLGVTPVDSGNSPSFQWSVNGNATGPDSPSFTYIPHAGDSVYCTMTLAENCTLMNSATSETLTMVVKNYVTPAIGISIQEDTLICLGDEVEFTAVIENGGDVPDYEWMVNGQPSGVNTASFITQLLNDQDEVYCLLTSSLECVDSNPVVSNKVTVSVDSCALSARWQKGSIPTVSLFPNPAKNKIFVQVSGLTGNFTFNLLNAQGQLIKSKRIEHPVTPFQQALALYNFPEGVYHLQIITDDRQILKRFLIR